MSLKVLNIDTTTLGDRSYLVHDGQTALIVDPQRDIDRINDLIVSEGVTLGAIFETHMHNDYLSGGLELAKYHGAEYVINEEDKVKFNRTAVVDNQVISVGTFALKAVHTPGHTFTHLSYQLLNPQSATVGIFTGGSLLHGATGRPDLLGWESARELAGMQHESAKQLAESLGDEVSVYPTHGFGSFCSATPTLADSSTIEDEKRSNPVLLNDLQSYIDLTLAGLDAYPTYFEYMGPGNVEGAKAIDLSEISRMSTDELLRAIESGAWIVDLRNRTSWSENHLLGTLSFGIDGSLASYLGWLYPYGRDLFLISDNSENISEAQRELVRIGIDRPTGAYVGAIPADSKTSSIRVAAFSDLPEAMRGSEITILDVRQIHEREISYIQSSLFIPFYEVQSRVQELPTSGEIWVHCASGYRASTILGFIESSGRTPVLINQEYTEAALVDGLTVISSDAAEVPATLETSTSS